MRTQTSKKTRPSVARPVRTQPAAVRRAFELGVLKPMARLAVGCALALAPQGADAAARCLLAGDYPDPTILRDGENFYMTHSPFDYSPAFLLWQSHDLAHWTPLGFATPHRTGALAPDLVKSRGRYYIYYQDKVMWADAISGPWQGPKQIAVRGFDPGHLELPDGSRWLFSSDGYVTRLAADGLSARGDPVKSYDGWRFPKEWEAEGFCLESPKAFWKDGYIYLTCAQGGTAGPATGHMVVSARARSPLGPWENSPYNPILRTASAEEPWWSKGHGTVFEDGKGGWWIVYHAYAAGLHTLGRHTLIEPVEWDKKGWWRVSAKDGRAKRAPQLSTPPLWFFDREETAAATAFTADGIEIVAHAGRKPADGNRALMTARDAAYEVEVTVEPGAGVRAGLLLFYSDKAYAGLVMDGRTLDIYETARSCAMRSLPVAPPCSFRIVFDRNKVSFFVRDAAEDGWLCVRDGLDLAYMNHNTFGGFLALRPALVSLGVGTARFRDFAYRPLLQHDQDKEEGNK